MGCSKYGAIGYKIHSPRKGALIMIFFVNFLPAYQYLKLYFFLFTAWIKRLGWLRVSDFFTTLFRKKLKTHFYPSVWPSVNTKTVFFQGKRLISLNTSSRVAKALFTANSIEELNMRYKQLL